MAFREVHRIAELDNLAKKVRPMAHALQNPRHLLPARLRAPLVVDGCHFSGGVCVFNQFDFGFFVRHPDSIYQVKALADGRLLFWLRVLGPGTPATESHIFARPLRVA